MPGPGTRRLRNTGLDSLDGETVYIIIIIIIIIIFYYYYYHYYNGVATRWQ